MKPSCLVSVFVGLAFLSACPPARSRAPGTPAWVAGQAPAPVVQRPRAAPKPPVRHLTRRERAIRAAEKHASPGGRAVLVAARHMIDKGVVVRGSCWDFAHAVYARAGFGSWRRQRRVYRARTRGPYANPSRVRAGDWLYIINHRATLATHSVIFVRWVDRRRRRALVITYVGGQRDAPGHYRSYNVSRIYHIIRPKVRKVRGLRVELKAKIHFPPHGVRLPRRALPLLHRIGQALRTHPSVTRVEVAGHCDPRESRHSRRPGLARARAVVRFLIRHHHIDPKRLVVKDYGPTRPLVSNRTARGRAQNRRVDFRVLQVGGHHQVAGAKPRSATH